MPGHVVAHPAALVRQRLAVGRERRGHPGTRPERTHVVGGAIGVVAGEAVAGDVGVDEPRVAGRHRVPVEPSAGERAGPGVGDEDVGLVDERGGHLPTLGQRQVQPDAALVAVVELEGRRHALDDPRQEAAERVAVGRLDLHHVGAPVAEDRGPGRPGDPHPDLDHLHAVHRSCHGRGT